MEKQKSMVLTALLLGITLLVTACGGSPAPGQGSSKGGAGGAGGKVEAVQLTGKLVLGTSADYPPYGFSVDIDGNQEIVGFDIEIAREIANDLGVKLEIRDMEFDGLLAALVAGNIDLIVAGMVPTEERKESVDFSIPYYSVEQRFLVRAADLGKLRTTHDLTGKRIGAQISTAQEKIAQEQIAGAGELRFLSRINELVLDLKRERIDGVVLVGPVAEAYAKADPQLAVSDIMFGQKNGVAIAIAKGNDDLTAAINESLKRMLAENMINQFIADATALLNEQQVE